ncbi:hypothetical protein B0H14DRAFT_2584405 [Mycena olivaceomarginata]|nr:hypothetical protein B0H14DRAFT_2584405 [Mycena olivaceomarginata]
MYIVIRGICLYTRYFNALGTVRTCKYQEQAGVPKSIIEEDQRGGRGGRDGRQCLVLMIAERWAYDDLARSDPTHNPSEPSLQTSLLRLQGRTAAVGLLPSITTTRQLTNSPGSSSDSDASDSNHSESDCEEQSASDSDGDGIPPPTQDDRNTLMSSSRSSPSFSRANSQTGSSTPLPLVSSTGRPLRRSAANHLVAGIADQMISKKAKR